MRPYYDKPCLGKPHLSKPYLLGKSAIPELRWLLREPSLNDYRGRFMDIRYDDFFKHVFGREENKDLLIHFLNSFYKGRITITDVRYCPTEFLGEDPETRKIICDILCYTDDGRYFLLEMQRAYQDFFPRRMMHYGCRMISHQVPAGKAGDDFGLKPVNLVSLLDFQLWDDPLLLAHPQGRYLRSADNTWIDTREPFNDVNWSFIQLPMFNKGLQELKADLDRWIFLFKNLSTLTERPSSFDHPAFKKLFDITDINKLSRKEKEMFKLTIDGDRDWRNAISFAERTGEERGEKRGEERGEKRGEKRKARVVVQSLIRKTDFNDEKIAELASVSVDFVKEMRTKS